jgi:hypothetical protein
MRLLPAQYTDGVAAPRTSPSLPDALAVSSALLKENELVLPHEHLTTMAAFWMQMIAYDVSYTIPISGFDHVSAQLFMMGNCRVRMQRSDHAVFARARHISQESECVDGKLQIECSGVLTFNRSLQFKCPQQRKMPRTNVDIVLSGKVKRQLYSLATQV